MRFGEFGTFGFQAFFTRGTLFFEIFDFAIRVFDTRLDFGDVRFGIGLLLVETFDFGLPLRDVRLEHVDFGIHAFKAATEGVHAVCGLQTFVRKLTGLRTQVIDLIAHDLERFAFTFQKRIQLVHVVFATENGNFFFETSLFFREFLRLLFAAFNFALRLVVRGLEARHGIAQADDIVVQVVEGNRRGLHFAFQIAVSVLVFANGKFLFFNLCLEFGRLRLRRFHFVVHALGRRIQRGQAFLVIFKLVQTDRQIEFAEARI